MYQFIFTIGLLLLSASPGKAAVEVRNGGYGKVIKGEIVPLDLVANDTYKDLYDSASFEGSLSGKQAAIIKATLQSLVGKQRLNSESLDIVIKKIAEIEEAQSSTAPLFSADALIKVIQRHKWVWHDLSCLDVGDETTVAGTLKQLAYREASFVRFCRDSQGLRPVYAAALVLHEIYYAALSTKSRLKELVNKAFSKKFGERDPATMEQFNEIMADLKKSSRIDTVIEPKPELILRSGDFVGGNRIHGVKKITLELDGSLAQVKIALDRHAGDLVVIAQFQCDSEHICRLWDDRHEIIWRTIQIKSPTTFIEFDKENRPTTFTFRP